MKDNSVSEFGKTVSGRSEDEMSTEALVKARRWYDFLMDAEFEGRGDREKSARGRLSDKTGIPQSYLFRLQYKMEEMRDVAGEVYLRLERHYNDLCIANEAAAERMRQERLELRQGYEADPKSAEQADSVDFADD